MEANIGTADRWIRVVIGLGVLVLGLIFKSWWGLLGLVPLLTITINWCPLYALVGISTCPTQRADK
jgi:hypothetical protein